MIDDGDRVFSEMLVLSNYTVLIPKIVFLMLIAMRTSDLVSVETSYHRPIQCVAHGHDVLSVGKGKAIPVPGHGGP
jgi:hypothetical protein